MSTTPLIINAYFLAHPFSGQGVYTVQILSILLSEYKGPITLLAPDTKSAEEARAWQKRFPQLRIKTFGLQFLPLRWRLLLAEYLWIPFILMLSSSYTYFSPYAHPALFLPKKGKHLMTLHDAIFFTQEAYQMKWSRKLYNGLLSHTVKNPDLQLLSVSETSAKEIQEVLQPAHRPLVVHNGIDHLRAEKLLTRPELEKRFGITKNYIFYHGGYDKRKNVGYALEIYAALKKEYPDLQMILGGKALHNSSLYEQVGSTPGVLQTGFISNAELRSLYHYASLFVSPSTEEGFNIPIGEALMEDTPVLTSNIPVHRELWEGHVTFMPLDNINSALQAAKIAIEQGRKPFSSHMFSWKNCCKKILEYFG